MSDLSRLTGVGPKRAKILAEAGIATLRDLVYHLPRRYLDRTKLTPIAELKVGEDALFVATVASINVIQSRMLVEVADRTGSIELVFFNGVQFLRRRFQEGQRLAVAGVPGFFRDLQMVHPEFEALPEGKEPKREVLPRYPLTVDMSEAHIGHKFLQQIALETLDGFQFTDPVAEPHRNALGLLPEAGLLRSLHRPEEVEGLPLLRRQLKVRELLPLSLKLEAVRRARRKVGRAWPEAKDLREKLRGGVAPALTPRRAGAGGAGRGR